jgi:hypothetical protein
MGMEKEAQALENQSLEQITLFCNKSQEQVCDVSNTVG